MTRIVRQDEVPALLPMEECVEAVEAALRALAGGDALQPLRRAMRLPDSSGLLGLMPAHLGPPRAVGVKVVTVMPGNHGTELDAHQGAVLLFEAERGRLLAVVDASSITAIRTGAASAVATRELAREDAGDLALLGSGVQAASHLEAMGTVRPIRRVRVWSRTFENARSFAERQRERRGVEIEAVASAREAAEGADVVCTTTSATEPVLEGAWLAAGAHVNAVGACVPTARELDTEAVARSRLFVDRRESALAEAGDLLIPLEEGAVDEDHVVAEIGDVLTESAPGRESDEEITVFESLGLGIYDLAAAHRVLRNAKERNAGTAIELGGRRVEP
ncbi:MAG: ornithine cyclodeaminase family protein [Gemmatimonadota bacterium]|nr:ornithine cyclodeaminase family protein [Gemmatimonadota bacterium]